MISFSQFNQHFIEVAQDQGACIRLLNNQSIIATFNPNSRLKSKVIMSGVHGDERGGPLAILQYLEKHKISSSRYQTIIIPLVNDDGWGRKHRIHQGVDLNRNFNESGPLHIQEIIKYLSEQDVEIFADLHEDIDEDGFVYKLSSDQGHYVDDLAAHLNCPVVVEDSHDEWGDTTEKFIRSLGCCKAVTTEAPGKVTPEEKIAWNYRVFEYIINL